MRSLANCFSIHKTDPALQDKIRELSEDQARQGAKNPNMAAIDEMIDMYEVELSNIYKQVEDAGGIVERSETEIGREIAKASNGLFKYDKTHPTFGHQFTLMAPGPGYGASFNVLDLKADVVQEAALKKQEVFIQAQREKEVGNEGPPSVIRRTKAEVEERRAQEAKLKEQQEAIEKRAREGFKSTAKHKDHGVDRARNIRTAFEGATTAAQAFDVLDSLNLNIGPLQNFIDLLKKAAGDQLANVQFKDIRELVNVFPNISNYRKQALEYKGNIYFNMGGLSFNKDREIAVLLVHETVHALTVKKVEGIAELEKPFNDLVEELRDRLLTPQEKEVFKTLTPQNFGNKKHLLTRLSEDHYYALSNWKELLSVAFSDQSFQDTLATLPTEGKPSFWKRLVNTVLSVLGFDTNQENMLSEVLSEAVRVISDGNPINLEASVNFAPDSLTTTKEKRKKSTKTEADQIAIMMENDKRGKPIDLLQEWTLKVKEVMKDIGKTSSERLRSAHVNLLHFTRRMEFQIATYNSKYKDRVKPFVDAYQKLSKEDKLLLDLKLINNTEEDIASRNAILKRNGMVQAYAEVEKVLKEIHARKDSVGLNKFKDITFYFPRRVKDVKALMRTIQEDPTYNTIQAQLEGLKTEADKEHAVMQMINTGRFPAVALKTPSASKERSIFRVSSEWKHHYENSVDALIHHIHESNEAVETRRMFGDVNRKKRVQKYNEIVDELETKDLSEEKRLKLLSELEQLDDQLENAEKEFSDGIAQFLKNNAVNMDQAQVDEVMKVLRARLNQKGMYGVAATVRNFMLMSTLGSPTSAITQIGDLAFSLSKYGFGNTIQAITGKAVITPQDLDLSNTMKEFQDGPTKWLDATLKWSGLVAMDRFGKTTTMNAAINSASKMSLEDFRKTYQEYLQSDNEIVSDQDTTARTYKDIVDKKNTELSQFFAYQALSDVQPISMSEMPVKYLHMQNGRLFYILKSFNIKALNNIYRESVHNLRVAKNNTEKMIALKNTGKLVFLLVLMGATADELKEFILGKSKTPFSDKFYDNVLKISMVNRYALDKSIGGDWGGFIGDLIMPPMNLVDHPYKDLRSLIQGEPDFKTLQSLPWGKLPYAWLSPTAEANDYKRVKERITKRVVKGDSISSIRKDMYKYNQWARRNKEKPITYSSLQAAKRRALKES